MEISYVGEIRDLVEILEENAEGEAGRRVREVARTGPSVGSGWTSFVGCAE